MLIKITKIALAGALVVGAASAALAGDNSGEYSGGFVIPGSTDGVNPVYHPELAPNSANGRKANALVPSGKLTPRTWQKGREAYDFVLSAKQERDHGEDYGPQANK
jgi:hypothetical protein